MKAIGSFAMIGDIICPYSIIAKPSLMTILHKFLPNGVFFRNVLLREMLPEAFLPGTPWCFAAKTRVFETAVLST
ncbi:hypothetical protein [Aureimonas fodinaquatilis]|uniref:hypothetical protein n=1 Tax=Aureimonas fodinaquatilis TaxID=2565783 RepID=UPI00165DF835|nr:hypothetical protein [Aureimonas fodinaquatilis]